MGVQIVKVTLSECTPCSKKDHIGVHSYPIKLVRYEWTPMWSLLLQGVHSDMVLITIWSALSCDP